MSNEKEPLVNLQLAIEHGLTEEEYNRILDVLGRTPTYTELGIFSVMWSEHCSYKNSIALLKTLPRSGGRLLVSAGEENAGLVDIGDGLAVAFKIESHNHPSAIEPYQGAATGVGGIMRDIFTMGARPIAALNSLRFGNPNDPRVKFLIKGIVKGIGDYGNCFGVPTVAGEIYFDECYTENPIVNAMSVGIVRHDEILKAAAKGKGNPVMIVGSATGRDGIHGATFASQEISEESGEKRPSVQVGDPFTEKLLLEATLEAAKTGYIVGIQDMGAAGIACSTSEMSERGKSGMNIDLNKVPVRETGMSAYEIMLSESQERMLVVVKKGSENKIQEIFEKWDLHVEIIGNVTDSEILKVYIDGILKAEIPAESLVLGGGAPVYYRESIEPKYLSSTKNFSLKEIPEPIDYNETLKNMLKSPNICSKKWVFQQYDSMVRTNTIPSGITDSAIIRIKDTNKALAIKTDGNARYVYLNPRKGAEIAVAESARNVICCGAKPIAITNCLNFGNPYNPENYWQFKEAVAGIGNACRVFETPVTGGNVSFYNESPNYSVFPTPVIGMLGLIEDLKHITTMEFKAEGDFIVLIGQNLGDLSGSEYLNHIHNLTVGDAPYFDIEYEKNVQATVLEAIQGGIVKSAHDVSDGGIAITLAECCIASNLGAEIFLENENRLDSLLFGEDQMRIVVTIQESNIDRIKEIVFKTKVDLRVIGKVKGSNLKINSEIDISVADLRNYYDNALTQIIEGE
ncbi:MAG: phosphoribosylformylglycinamidine synthase subunit PurL [Bacteroidota bacterium]|nr:phosphoribosylformylglycinamidine synthase subunit PurL [Bacteroidota bacterium]